MNDASISIVQAQPTTGRLRDVFDLKRPNFLCKTLIVFLNWFVITMLFYGLTMQAGKADEDGQCEIGLGRDFKRYRLIPNGLPIFMNLNGNYVE